MGGGRDLVSGGRVDAHEGTGGDLLKKKGWAKPSYTETTKARLPRNNLERTGPISGWGELRRKTFMQRRRPLAVFRDEKKPILKASGQQRGVLRGRRNEKYEEGQKEGRRMNSSRRN